MNERKKIEPTDTMVEAGASYAWEEANPGILGWNSISESHKEGCRRDARAVLTAALPHLTADDLRGTDAAEEIRTEGWLQGWAAGRDLDGDEDAIPYLRNTPAGRKLMAEGWDALIESMSASGEFHDVDLRTMQRLNPYRDGDA